VSFTLMGHFFWGGEENRVTLRDLVRYVIEICYSLQKHYIETSTELDVLQYNILSGYFLDVTLWQYFWIFFIFPGEIILVALCLCIFHGIINVGSIVIELSIAGVVFLFLLCCYTYLIWMVFKFFIGLLMHGMIVYGFI
jgi:hypothetical protein